MWVYGFIRELDFLIRQISLLMLRRVLPKRYGNGAFLRFGKSGKVQTLFVHT